MWYGRARRLLVMGGLAALVTTFVAGVAIAAAGQVTTIYTGNGTQFAVKPKLLVMDSADGGELQVTWTTWNGTIALGHGTSHPDHGSYPIVVKLSDPEWGTFQRLTITFQGLRGSGVTTVDPLDLSDQREEPTFLLWASASWIKNAGASGLEFYTPNFGTGCTIGNLGPSAIGGLFGISSGAACGVAQHDYAAHGLKACGNGQIGHSVLKSYEGYSVTNEYPTGIFFERGSSYFSLVLGCPGE
jgi:hypothetical protein